MDLTLLEDEEYLFEVVGKKYVAFPLSRFFYRLYHFQHYSLDGKLHRYVCTCAHDERRLTACLLDQRGPDADPFSDEDSEDGYDLRDVSSDVEVYPDELDIPSDDEG